MLTSLYKYKDINKPSTFSYLADICPHMFSKYFGEIIHLPISPQSNKGFEAYNYSV